MKLGGGTTECSLMCSLEQENPYVHGKDRHVADVLSRLSIPSPDLASFPGLHTQLLSLAVRKAGEGLDGLIT